MSRRQPTPPPSALPPGAPVFRSAAVARLANMPVATLRIWEQRYAAVQPATAASGHRQYSSADVQRVLLLRQLTERGHAIGAIAALDAAQLQQVAQAAQRPAAVPEAGRAHTAPPLQLAVVGPALALRLQREAVLRRLGAVRVGAVYDTLAQAARARGALRCDLLLWSAPELQPGVPRELRAAQRACGARRVAVLYRFAGAASAQALADTGAEVAREPADDVALGQWLASLAARLPARAASRSAKADTPAPSSPGAVAATVAPRRFDDAQLTAIAGRSPQLACECPRHVAELLMQLASFEAYSAGCRHRHRADAELHAYLHHVAGASRALFEAALLRVAEHEGLALP